MAALLLTTTMLVLTLTSLPTLTSAGMTGEAFADWQMFCAPDEAIAGWRLFTKADFVRGVDFKVFAFCRALNTPSAPKVKVLENSCYARAEFVIGRQFDFKNYTYNCDYGDYIRSINSTWVKEFRIRTMNFICCKSLNARLNKRIGCNSVGPVDVYKRTHSFLKNPYDPRDSCPSDVLTAMEYSKDGLAFRYCPLRVLGGDYNTPICRAVKTTGVINSKLADPTEQVIQALPVVGQNKETQQATGWRFDCGAYQAVKSLTFKYDQMSSGFRDITVQYTCGAQLSGSQQSAARVRLTRFSRFTDFGVRAGCRQDEVLQGMLSTYEGHTRRISLVCSENSNAKPEASETFISVIESEEQILPPADKEAFMVHSVNFKLINVADSRIEVSVIGSRYNDVGQRFQTSHFIDENTGSTKAISVTTGNSGAGRRLFDGVISSFYSLKRGEQLSARDLRTREEVGRPVHKGVSAARSFPVVAEGVSCVRGIKSAWFNQCHTEDSCQNSCRSWDAGQKFGRFRSAACHNRDGRTKCLCKYEHPQRTCLFDEIAPAGCVCLCRRGCLWLTTDKGRSNIDTKQQQNAVEAVEPTSEPTTEPEKAECGTGVSFKYLQPEVPCTVGRHDCLELCQAWRPGSKLGNLTTAVCKPDLDGSFGDAVSRCYCEYENACPSEFVKDSATSPRGTCHNGHLRRTFGANHCSSDSVEGFHDEVCASRCESWVPGIVFGSVASSMCKPANEDAANRLACHCTYDSPSGFCDPNANVPPALPSTPTATLPSLPGVIRGSFGEVRILRKRQTSGVSVIDVPATENDGPDGTLNWLVVPDKAMKPCPAHVCNCDGVCNDWTTVLRKEGALVESLHTDNQQAHNQDGARMEGSFGFFVIPPKV